VESPDFKKQSLPMEEEDRLEREKVASREELYVGAPAPAPASAPAPAPAPAHAHEHSHAHAASSLGLSLLAEAWSGAGQELEARHHPTEEKFSNLQVTYTICV
jgi:hypothetical protein